MILDAALAYARRGLPVFPLRGKLPLTEHGCKDASVDPDAIRGWWSRFPDANIALPTGAVSGLAVLDVDPRHGGDESLAALEGKHGPLPETVESRTGGGGRHFFFSLADGRVIRNSAGKLGPGLDVRGEGGYVVVPPSIHPETRKLYVWVKEAEPVPPPAWLMEALYAPASGSGSVSDAPIPAGQRNDTLSRIAGAMRRKGCTQAAIEVALLAENARRCSPPLPENEVRAIAQSVSRYVPESEAPGGFPAPSAWPEPLAEHAFHGLAGEIVRAIEPHTEADSAALLLQFLVAAGSVIGRGPFFTVEQHRHHVNLFAVIVGLTSKARKGTSWSRIVALLQEVDPFWAENRIHGGIGSGEGIIWSVRDPILKGEKLVEDGVEDKRLLLLESEFAQPLAVIQRQGNTTSEILRRAWDGTSLQTLTKNTSVRATGAHISMIGHITQGELIRHLSETEIGNGLANRFIFCCARRSKVLPEGGSPIDQSQLSALIERLRGAIDFARHAGEMKRSDTARELWREVYPDLSDGKPGLLGAVISCRYIFGDRLGDPLADEILRGASRQAGRADPFRSARPLRASPL